MWDEEADDTQTPDLQASAGLSYGGTTPQLMEMLQRMGPSPTQRAGQALAGGVAFARGQANPVTPIINQQMQQQNMVIDMIQNMERTKVLRENQKSATAIAHQKLLDAKETRESARQMKGLEWMGDLAKNPGVPAEIKALIQPQVAAGFKKQFGFDLPGNYYQEKITDEMRNSLLSDLSYGVPPEVVQRRHSWMDPNDLPTWTNIARDPKTRKNLNLATNEDLQKEHYDREIKRASFIKSLMPPGMRDDGSNSQFMQDLAFELFPETDLINLDRAQQKRVSDTARLRMKEAEMDKFSEQEKIRVAGQIKVLEARNQFEIAEEVRKANQEKIMGKPDPATGRPMTQQQVLNNLKDFQDGSLAVREMDKLIRDLKAFPPSAFPSKPDQASRWIAKQVRERIYGGDDAVINYNARVMNVMNGIWGRKFYDDKGNRAWESQKKEYEVIDNLPPLSAIENMLKDAQNTVRAKLKETLRGYEESGAAPEGLLNAARKAYGRIAPRDPVAQPKPEIPIAAPPQRKQFMDTRTGKIGWYKFNIGDVKPPHLQEIAP